MIDAGQPGTVREPLTISCVGIVTRNRPRALKRCLVSALEHLRYYGRTSEIVVCDDSDSPTAQNGCRQMTHSIARRFGVSSCYAGAAEKRAYTDRLIRLGIEPAVARFALTRPKLSACPGANRNTLLLHCTNEAFLSCDDDSVWLVEDLRSGIQTPRFVPFASTADRTRFIGSADPSIAAPPRDLVAAHEELLGRSVRELVVPLPEAATGLVSRTLNHLREGKGHVVVTMSGVLGDSGLPHAAPFMTSAGEARSRFLAAWEAGKGWNATRNVVLGVNTPTLSWQGPFATTTATGFDHHKLLPPFVPGGCGEDTLFGSMLDKCLPDAYIGNVPVALTHAPPDQRTYRSLPVSFRMADILSLILQECPHSATGSTTERLKTAGRYVTEFGRLAQADFETQLLKKTIQWRMSAMNHCRRLLETYRGEPRTWAVEIERWMADLEHGLARRDAAVPTDWIPSNARRGGHGRARVYVQRFGELLQAWPDIVTAARILRATGDRAGQRVN